MMLVEPALMSVLLLKCFDLHPAVPLPSDIFVHYD
jgi:hypothetical protein